MTVASHLQELRRKHEHLSTKVEQEQRSPGSDAMRIADLKKQKLKLKEEITRLSQAWSFLSGDVLTFPGTGHSRQCRPPGDHDCGDDQRQGCRGKPCYHQCQCRQQWCRI